VGAGGSVISGKRESYDNWAIARLESNMQEVMSRLQVCESSRVQMLHGAGTTNPSKLFWELLGLMTARAKFAVHATYRAVGSSTGQKEFLGASNGNVALNHFGSGDIPMTADRYSAVAAAGRTMVHVPFAVGGIGVFHSAPVGGATVDLTACVLAKIFSAQITMWDDAEIAALNAGVTLPSLPIKVVHRVKGSSSTAGFTAYMLATCPASWTLGTGSTITWPAGTNEGQGSDGMSQFIEDNEGA
jgi:phosphate transport system substrate-binding protein